MAVTINVDKIKFRDQNGNYQSPVVLQGEKGDTGLQGPKGDPGDDYTLTAQDKSDIAELVENDLDPVISNVNSAADAALDAAENANNATKYIGPSEATSTASAAHAKGSYLIYDGKLYKVTADIAIGDTLATTGTGANIAQVTGGAMGEVADLKSQIQQKANIDGYYESMTVGNAEQLVATVGVEDSAPYNFRTAGGSADIGDRLVDKIVGGTICWNQIQENKTSKVSAGVTFTYNESNGKLTVNGTAESNTWWLAAKDKKWDFYKDHVYLLDVGNKDYGYAGGIGQNPYWYVPSGFSSNALLSSAVIRKCTTSVETYFQFMIYQGNEVDATYIPQVFDLTQMFGSTIADYIFSLETATAGAGVAWFRRLFPKDYYAYNAGELMSVQAASHKTVGFNAWDEEWRLASLDTSTGAWSSIGTYTQIASANMIRVVPGATYYFASSNIGGTYVAKYKEDGTYIGCQRCWSTNRTFTVPDDCHYIMFQMNEYGTTYNHDICINLSWDGERDGEYEEYTEHVYPLDDSLTLRGIPKLDSSNNPYYDGDTYESDGTVTRRYGVVTFDGSADEMWSYYSITSSDNANNLFRIIVADRKAANIGPYSDSIKVIANNFTIATNQGAGRTNMTVSGSNTNIDFVIASCSSLDAWKTYLASNPITVVYPLATPTTETADPFQNPQIVNDFGTEEYVDAGVTAATPTRDVAIPVGHETTYQANLRAKLEMAPDSPSDGDGDYIVRQTNGTNEYAKLVIPTELPTTPTTDGTYHLKATVSGGTTTLTWEADT